MPKYPINLSRIFIYPRTKNFKILPGAGYVISAPINASTFLAGKVLDKQNCFVYEGQKYKVTIPRKLTANGAQTNCKPVNE